MNKGKVGFYGFMEAKESQAHVRCRSMLNNPATGKLTVLYSWNVPSLSGLTIWTEKREREFGRQQDVVK